jgi:hypothetical protein
MDGTSGPGKTAKRMNALDLWMPPNYTASPPVRESSILRGGIGSEAKEGQKRGRWLRERASAFRVETVSGVLDR